MQRNFIMNGGASKRYHTVDTLTKQDIAAHSFGVAWLCELLTQGRASKNLIMAALAHDLAEHIVGDVPSPAKRTLQVSDLFHELETSYLTAAGLAHYYGALPKEEKLYLQLADMVEGMCFCLRERRYGNRNVDIVFERFHTYATELMEANDFLKSDTVAHIIADVSNEWMEIVNE